MQMEISESDKFFSYLGGCAEIGVLDLNQDSPHPESYEEWKISDPFPRPSRPFLHFQFHLPMYLKQPAEFFAEFNPGSRWSWLQNR